MSRVVVVGGGLAGARTCETLRSNGFEGEIVLLAAERHLPYDRPPLTKAALRGDSNTRLRTDYEALKIDVRVGVAATGLDLQSKKVETAQGAVEYDTLVIATGAAPIMLPGSSRQLAIRTVDDSQKLRELLKPGAKVVLVGASWIGAEVATAALAAGAEVTCVEYGPAPLANALGVDVGTRFVPWWDAVDLRVGVGVREVTDTGVTLDTGEDVSADVVVAGIGVRPDVSWLEDSGLSIARGIEVDEHLRTSDPHVFAVGDVAVRWSPRSNQSLHVEHWDDARTGPDAVARTIVGREPAVHDPVPYFWSDQFGHKIQYVGHHSATDAVVVRHGDDDKWAAAWLDDSGVLTAHLSIDTPKLMIGARAAIAAGTRPDATALRDITQPLS
ncbi:FAD-dependent oxidoreductase [Rhodococcus sp. BP-252]|uniref:Oxidoreductase n=1 Tax=Rhodococcoides kyotonense TaxID=398843 RepID=A0A177YLE5_9NOCA|nr:MULTISPECIES: FAD-dependent oxidoreductase [Rhodococcus]MBY6412592.1 FAD-dependent oxidoreductase [Rhodococcus sp. BP-320]MBY6417153.1 FAD-dependent oxidoreductase [Rhodococcus sp. BP-321]MBY6423241.1 FAD-dependent oxidoreductase [Rhodococcus sp. BP-324]MBY6427177.1 FAD-dependent oxidoreductase [Rhodococcus sp. BP-323]MBY6432210.1 FAD-dependent oxidoreductase [Rhodococcus sp. BP-322]